MWVLGVGQPVLDTLLAHYQATSNKLIKNAGLGLELFEDIEDAPHLPIMADRILAVDKELLVAEGDAIAGQVLWSYRLVYEGESQEGVHAGLAAVLGHLDDTDERPWLGVHAQRREAGDGAGTPGEMLGGAASRGQGGALRPTMTRDRTGQGAHRLLNPPLRPIHRLG